MNQITRRDLIRMGFAATLAPLLLQEAVITGRKMDGAEVQSMIDSGQMYLVEDCSITVGSTIKWGSDAKLAMRRCTFRRAPGSNGPMICLSTEAGSWEECGIRDSTFYCEGVGATVSYQGKWS